MDFPKLGLRLRLVPYWKLRLARFWSNKFNLLSAFFSGCALALPAFTDTFSKKGFAFLALFFTIAAVVAGLFQQEKALPDNSRNQLQEKSDGNATTSG